MDQGDCWRPELRLAEQFGADEAVHPPLVHNLHEVISMRWKKSVILHTLQ
jgi:hypothetical protein